MKIDKLSFVENTIDDIIKISGGAANPLLSQYLIDKYLIENGYIESRFVYEIDLDAIEYSSTIKEDDLKEIIKMLIGINYGNINKLDFLEIKNLAKIRLECVKEILEFCKFENPEHYNLSDAVKRYLKKNKEEKFNNSDNIMDILDSSTIEDLMNSISMHILQSYTLNHDYTEEELLKISSRIIEIGKEIITNTNIYKQMGTLQKWIETILVYNDIVSIDNPEISIYEKDYNDILLLLDKENINIKIY